MSWDFASNCQAKRIIAQGTTFAATGNSSAVDMETCRNALVIVDFTKGNDNVTNLTLEHSSDNSTFATHSIIDASIAATEFNTYSVKNLKRYVRVSWTRSTANADSTWGVCIVGDLAVYENG